MKELLSSILDKNIPEIATQVELKLPTLNKINNLQLPKLEKLNG